MSLDVSTASWEVQVAILNVLTGDAPHADKVSGTYDQVPQGAAYPYETIGESQDSSADTFTDGVAELTCTIHTWSQYKGKKEAKDLQADHYRLLHRQDLTLATLHFISCWRQSATVLQDPDGITYHGVEQYLVRVQSA